MVRDSQPRIRRRVRPVQGQRAAGSCAGQPTGAEL